MISFRKASIWLIQILVITIPLEISKLLFPFLLLDDTVGNRSVSLIDLSRITSIVLILLMGFYILHRLRLPPAPYRFLIIPFLLFVSYIVSWTITPAPNTARNEVVRLTIHLLICVTIIWVIKDEKDISRILGSFRVITLILGIIVVFQAITGVYLWNNGLAISGRYNATLGDPNILGRYMVIGFFAWAFAHDDLRQKPTSNVLKFLGMMLCFLGILLSYSRSSWVIFAGTMFLLLLIAPKKQRKVAFALLVTSVIVFSITAFLHTNILVRLQSFSLGFGIAGARISLIQAGIRIFQDHPFFGVGLGGFPIEYLTKHRDLLSYVGEGLHLSHTYIITTAAELGIIGLAITFVFLTQSFLTLLFLMKNNSTNRSFSYCILISSIGIATIFLSSQAEGRFWEDPYLWVFWALLLSGYKIFSFRKANERILHFERA